MRSPAGSVSMSPALAAFGALVCAVVLCHSAAAAGLSRAERTGEAPPGAIKTAGAKPSIVARAEESGERSLIAAALTPAPVSVGIPNLVIPGPAVLSPPSLVKPGAPAVVAHGVELLAAPSGRQAASPAARTGQVLIAPRKSAGAAVRVSTGPRVATGVAGVRPAYGTRAQLAAPAADPGKVIVTPRSAAPRAPRSIIAPLGGTQQPARRVPAVGPIIAVSPGAAQSVRPALGESRTPVVGSGSSVTPSQAAQMAIDNSIDLQITAANIREAEAQLRQAFGLDDFRVTVGATYGRRGPIATAEFPAGEGEDPTIIELGDPVISTQQLDLVKPLYSSKRIERTQSVALKTLETRKLSQAVVARALDLTARQASYGVMRAEQLAQVAQQQASAVAAHVDLTRKLMTEGVVPKFELVQAETELAGAQGDVIALRTAVEQAKSGLRRVLTLAQETPLGVEPGEMPRVPAGTKPELISDAWEQRPELHAARAGIALAQAALRLAGTTSDLSVNLVGGMTRTRASFGAEEFGWQVAVAAQAPILDGKQEKTEVQKARAQLEAATLDLERQKQDIALQVAQGIVALDDGRERLKVARQGIVEAQERLRIAQVRYQNGIALGVEVLDAQTALAAASAELVNSEYNLQLSIAELRSAVGLWSGNE